jgi:tetrahydromethanopterin S-methyltransferase subunit D
MRPRFGAGAKTALIAGVTAWFFGCLMTAVAMSNMGLMPRDLLMTTTIAELVVLSIAALAGGWLYREA